MNDISLDDVIRDILAEPRRIAVIGASPRSTRPSHGVMGHLIQRGHTIFPVNPNATDKPIHGRPVAKRLDDVRGPVYMVDIFRNADQAGQAVDDAIRLKNKHGIQVVWMQLGVINPAAAARARASGLTVIMDRCPVIEYRRLF